MLECLFKIIYSEYSQIKVAFVSVPPIDLLIEWCFCFDDEYDLLVPFVSLGRFIKPLVVVPLVVIVVVGVVVVVLGFIDFTDATDWLLLMVVVVNIEYWILDEVVVAVDVLDAGDDELRSWRSFIWFINDVILELPLVVCLVEFSELFF